MKQSPRARTLAWLMALMAVNWPGLNGGRVAGATPPMAGPVQRVLPDGSVVELANGAGIAVEYGDKLRAVTLKSGEGRFHVAKDRFRPFVVRAGGIDVRAVGTAFAVSLERPEIAIAVTEGRVAVQRRMQPASSGGIAQPETIALVAAGSRVVLLEFQATPLAEAISRINRRAGVRLVIRDAALEKLAITAILPADGVDAWLRLLREDFQVEAEHLRGEISLRKAGTR